ncbi:MAG: hypothetical protein WA001_01140 [Patescibacteria group bacterium]
MPKTFSSGIEDEEGVWTPELLERAKKLFGEWDKITDNKTAKRALYDIIQRRNPRLDAQQHDQEVASLTNVNTRFAHGMAPNTSPENFFAVMEHVLREVEKAKKSSKG